MRKKDSTKNEWRDKARATERVHEKIFTRFAAAVSALGDGTISTIVDDLGGTLFYFYRPASPGDYVEIEYEYMCGARSAKSPEERAAILAERLPQLQQNFSQTLRAVIEGALKHHSKMCVGDLRGAIIGVSGWSEVSCYDGSQEFQSGIKPTPVRKVRYDYAAGGAVRSKDLGVKGRGGARNIKHLWTDDKREQLTDNYSQLLPMWQEAKKIRLAAAKSKERARKDRWREAVKATYGEFPDDLIELLDAPDGVKPGDLAIEHAARICGVLPGTYNGAKQLRSYLVTDRRNSKSD